jgi:hypothetical protein
MPEVMALPASKPLSISKLQIKKTGTVNPREEYILQLHTTIAKPRLAAGPANYISQIFY